MNVEKGMSYYAHHKPSGEDWFILGISVVLNRVCAAGWPATIGNLSDCENFEVAGALSSDEIAHRTNKFGSNWDN